MKKLLLILPIFNLQDFNSSFSVSERPFNDITNLVSHCCQSHIRQNGVLVFLWSGFCNAHKNIFFFLVLAMVFDGHFSVHGHYIFRQSSSPYLLRVSEFGSQSYFFVGTYFFFLNDLLLRRKFLLLK